MKALVLRERSGQTTDSELKQRATKVTRVNDVDEMEL